MRLVAFFLIVMFPGFLSSSFLLSLEHRRRSFRGVPSLLWFSSQTDHDYLDKVREGVDEAGWLDDWNAAAGTLAESISCTTEEAEAALAVGCNWKSWAVTTSSIARKYIKTVKPDVKTITNSLTWLREGPLALTDEQVLRRAVLEHPKAYLTDPAATYGRALSVAPERYCDPAAFRQALLEDPSVLQCTHNCVDSGCSSECGNCWVSYDLGSWYRPEETETK
jgi:hypothetical protein